VEFLSLSPPSYGGFEGAYGCGCFGRSKEVSMEFHMEFYDIKYTDVAKRENTSFMRCEKSFIPTDTIT
jgi:hypothetical protein